MDGERARVDIANGVDQADHAARAAQVEAGQRLSVGRQVEERVAGQHLLAAVCQPVVELALLAGRRVQLVPHVGAAARWPQPGQSQLRAEPVGDRLEVIELADVLPGHHHGDLEAAEARRGQVAHRAQRGGVGARAAYRVVDPGGGAVERDLHVDVVAGGQAAGHRRADLHAVGRELHPDVVGGGVVHQVPEVGPDGGLAAADVHVEHLHPLQLVDHRPALRGSQLARVAAARAGQAVHAGQVAGVRQLPGQADRRVQPVGELLHQRQCCQGLGHELTRAQIIWEAARVSRAAA